MRGLLRVERGRWSGYRWQQHGLSGSARKEALDDLLLLGFQDSRGGGAEQSLRQRRSRIGSTSVQDAISPEGPLVCLWSVRGAPHVHRVTHLDLVRDAHAPQESDEGGAGQVAAVEEVAAALRAVVKTPTSKAQASTEVTAQVSARLVSWCARCEARHVPDALFRAAGRQAQLVLGPEEQRATVLHPAPRHPQVTVDRPRRQLIDAYFRVNGPTSKTQFRDWMEGSNPSSRAAGPTAALWKELGDELVRVQVDNRRYDLPEELAEALDAASPPEGVVLVPPHDPYLRQVDRTLLVPDATRRGLVWKALSAPGALLVDGEVAGVWRYRRSADELTLTAFERLSAERRRSAEASARLLAQATGSDQPRISWD